MGNQPFVLGEQQSVLPFLLGNKIQISIGISGQNNHTAEALAAHVAGSVVQGCGVNLNGSALRHKKRLHLLSVIGIIVQINILLGAQQQNHISAGHVNLGAPMVFQSVQLFIMPVAVANLNGGTFEGTTWYVIKNLGTITMNGASVTQNDAGSSAIDNGWYGNPGNDCNVNHPGNGYTAKLTIANGNFSGGMNTVKNDDYGVLEISGGTFSNTNGPTVLNWNVATISGGEFKVNSTATSVIANGSFNNEADKGQLTITGGQFTSSDNGNGNLLGYGVGGQNGGSVTISGGKFTGKMVAEGYPYEPVISGGTFSDQENAKKYLDNDNLVVNPATGKVEPKSITIIVPSEGGNTTTTPSTDNTKNPSTGANDFVGVAAAMAVVSLLGAAAVIRKK